MRVLFYHPVPVWTGSARVLDAIARGMAARQWEVTVVCAAGSAVEERLATAGYDLVPLPPEGGWLALSWRLRRVLLDRFVEVVTVQTDRDHLISGTAMRLAERGAVVRRVPPGARYRPLLRGRVGARLATTDVLFSARPDVRPVRLAGRQPREPYLAEIGVSAESYDVVRPVPRANLGAPASGRLIVCACGPGGRLRAATALRTVALLAPRHPELRLALTGPGAADEELRMHAAALGITRIVTHVGENEDQLPVLRAADLGWVAAAGDDAALGFLDFMALRVPVVAERGTLAQHYVADGISGMLVQPDDVPMTAARVTALLAREEQRVAMGNAGRARVGREFTDTAMLDGFEAAAAAARDRTRWRL